MTDNFNSYLESEAVNYWRNLCFREGELRHYDKGDYFFTEGEVARYIGFIKSGTLKYVAFSEDGTEHVLGLEFTGGFVADFPFSLSGIKARTSVIATSPCDILCIPTRSLMERMENDTMLKDTVMKSTEAVFSTVYNRYKALYSQSPRERYDELISRHHDLFQLFSLKDIASFLNITPTHLSRLRKNLEGV